MRLVTLFDIFISLITTCRKQTPASPSALHVTCDHTLAGAEMCGATGPPQMHGGDRETCPHRFSANWRRALTTTVVTEKCCLDPQKNHKEPELYKTLYLKSHGVTLHFERALYPCVIFVTSYGIIWKTLVQ